MGIPSENLTIGMLATQAQVNVETIRFYHVKALCRNPAGSMAACVVTERMT